MRPSKDGQDNKNAGAINSAKIPWKKVTDYISDHGGSYKFGFATCKKKWIEVQCKSEKEVSLSAAAVSSSSPPTAHNSCNSSCNSSSNNDESNINRATPSACSMRPTATDKVHARGFHSMQGVGNVGISEAAAATAAAAAAGPEPRSGSGSGLLETTQAPPAGQSANASGSFLMAFGTGHGRRIGSGSSNIAMVRSSMRLAQVRSARGER